MNLKKLSDSIGPGPLITAAFIGPGTVTVCTLAGIRYDYTLLWALVLSVVATVFLQELSGRLGILTRMDLSQLVRTSTESKWKRFSIMTLILLAIGLGNVAYQGGNITGTSLGLGIFLEVPSWKLGQLAIQPGNLAVGFLAAGLLWTGNYKQLERILVGLVILMSIAFIIAAALTKPDLSSVLRGFVPTFSSEKLPTLVALIGTTVVPYNLFLYASLVQKQWTAAAELPLMRRDLWVSIVLGGLVSGAILVVGVANSSSNLETAQDIARGLTGVFGVFGTYLMGFGLMAAGLTSSLTAPLAAGLVICGVLDWSQNMQSTSMRASMGAILLLGILFSSFGIKPVTLITLAQLANGILLPLISGWLLWMSSSKRLLGTHALGIKGILFGTFIWMITLILGIKSFGAALGWF
ncbi:MAG: Nramp family divalent metal transporter [Bacteroidetes bacterium]|nr:Nramp family divalent metal transporter [Bacteroidota bacterium]